MLKKLKAILSIDIVPYVLGTIIFSSTLIMGSILADSAQKQLLEQLNYQLQATASYARLVTGQGLYDQPSDKDGAPEAAYKPYGAILETRHEIDSIFTLIPCQAGLCFSQITTNNRARYQIVPLSPYRQPTPTLLAAFKNQTPATEPTVFRDEFGSYLGAYQPIYDSNGHFKAMLGVKMNSDYYMRKVGQIKKNLYFGLMISSLFSMFVATAVYLMRRKMAMSELRYKSLVDNIPAVVFECRLDDHLTMSFLNNEIHSLTGYSAEQLLKNQEISFASLIHEDETGATLKEIQRQIDKQNLFDLEFRLTPQKNARAGTVRNRSLVWVKVRGIKVGEDYDGTAIIEGYMQDITIRKNTEAKLLENQRHIKDLADSMPNLLWITNPYGDSVFYNKTWLDFTGRNLSQEIDDGWMSNIHPEDKDAIMNKFLRALSDELAFECWFRILRSDGVYRWMLANCTPKRNQKGDCDGFICVATDITERKAFENEIRNANEQMEQVFLHAPASIAVLDKDLRYVVVSERWKKLTHIDDGDLIGKYLSETTSDRSAAWRDAFVEALKGKVITCPVGKYIDPSGEENWLKIEVHPWIKDGQINGIMIFAENVTDSYRATEEIRRHRDNLQDLVDAQTKKLIEESEKNILLRTIIAAANEAQDMDSALQSCIEEVCAYTGWDLGHCFLYDPIQESLVSSKIVSRSAHDLYPQLVATIYGMTLSLDIHQCLPARTFNTNVAGWQSSDTIKGVSPRAKSIQEAGLGMTMAFPITVNGTPIGVFEFFAKETTGIDDNLLGLLGNIGVQFGRVIERFRHEEILTKAKEMAEASAKAKSEFLSNMSHELRTPMHAILNYASMSLKRVGNVMQEPSTQMTDGKLEKYISNIQTAGNRLLELLNNLLDLAKMESGKMSYVFAEHSLLDIVDRTTAELDSLLSAKHISVQINKPDVLNMARFDPQRMIQVCVNLFSNAIKFTPDKSTLTVDLNNVVDTELGQALQFSIADEGPGIPENEVSIIFETFTQSSKTKSGAGGTGLGLTIAKQIVEAHNGRIWAENTATGAKFNVCLPLNPEAITPSESGHRQPLAVAI